MRTGCKERRRGDARDEMGEEKRGRRPGKRRTGEKSQGRARGNGRHWDEEGREEMTQEGRREKEGRQGAAAGEKRPGGGECSIEQRGRESERVFCGDEERMEGAERGEAGHAREGGSCPDGVSVRMHRWVGRGRARWQRRARRGTRWRGRGGWTRGRRRGRPGIGGGREEGGSGTGKGRRVRGDWEAAAGGALSLSLYENDAERSLSTSSHSPSA